MRPRRQSGRQDPAKVNHRDASRQEGRFATVPATLVLCSGEITWYIDIYMSLQTGVPLCFAYPLKAIRAFYLRCTVNKVQNDAGHKHRGRESGCWFVGMSCLWFDAVETINDATLSGNVANFPLPPPFWVSRQRSTKMTVQHGVLRRGRSNSSIWSSQQREQRGPPSRSTPPARCISRNQTVADERPGRER